MYTVGEVIKNYFGGDASSIKFVGWRINYILSPGHSVHTSVHAYDNGCEDVKKITSTRDHPQRKNDEKTLGDDLVSRIA